MPKGISIRKLIQNLRILGFDGPYSGGRHLFMVKGSLKLRVPNPHGEDISQDLVSRILRQAGINSTEWRKIK